MYIEIQAKTLLATIRGDDPVYGMKYNMNLYRGCEHQCIYCDSRSECYGIEYFKDVLVKVNAIDLLERELQRKKVIGTIGFGSMSDPYTLAEMKYGLTGKALEVISRRGFPVHLNTKSDRILKDAEMLAKINRVHASVCFTITTTDDDLASVLEPGAPRPSARLRAMAELARCGVKVGTGLMPVLPFLEDTVENILQVVDATADHGGTFILPWFGMSLRDRQRVYYYDSLDRHFPGLRARYERTYGNRYFCPAQNADSLAQAFYAHCTRRGIQTHVPRWQPDSPVAQLSLW